MSTYTIRPATVADADSIARVHVDSWRTTYAGIVPQAYLDGLSYESRIESWSAILKGEGPYAVPRGAIFVLQDPTVCGFASGGPIRGSWPPYDGELYSVYLLAHTQGRGHGSRLVKTVTQHVVGLDLTSMLVWVLADNPACRFYEVLGAQRTPYQQSVDIGGKDLIEVAYGWPDIHTLLGGK